MKSPGALAFCRPPFKAKSRNTSTSFRVNFLDIRYIMIASGIHMLRTAFDRAHGFMSPGVHNSGSWLEAMHVTKNSGEPDAAMLRYTLGPDGRAMRGYVQYIACFGLIKLLLINNIHSRSGLLQRVLFIYSLGQLSLHVSRRECDILLI